MRSGARTRFAALTTTTAAAVGLALAVPLGAAGVAGAAARTATVTPAAREAAAAAAAVLRQRTVLHVRNGSVVRHGPNPALALQARPGDADYAGWARSAPALAAAWAQARAQARLRAGATAAAARLAVTEKETRRGTNDSRATAQRITGFGTGAGKTGAADIRGTQLAGPRPAVEQLPPNKEDDGGLDLARVTGVSTQRGGFGTTGTIGDAPPVPPGELQFDDDYYALDLAAGQLLDVRMAARSGDLVPAMALLDQDGNFIADFEQSADGRTATLNAPVVRAGRYYLFTTGFFIFDDVTQQEHQSTGRYGLTITARAGDIDYYAVTLAGGDVVGANVAGAGHVVSIINDEGALLMGSTQDATFIYPANTPLPGGGNAVADTVAPRTGTYYVAISGGSGPYTAQVEVYRPGGTGKVRQTIFLDLDGQRLNTGIFGGRGVTTLSPLSSFLPRWGLKPAQRAALGKAIKATVEENVRKDLQASGLSSTVSVSVVTSDEVADPFGKPGVSRVIVGGTIDESGVGTIGIAQSIDPGNFSREETALVLLDLLSEQGPDKGDYSLNVYLKPRSNRVGFVGQAVGNVVSHEIGHYIGNWHTDNGDEQAELMDAGGQNFDVLFGVGPDHVGGTADDVDVDFGADAFSPFEGFLGTENTRARSTWGLSR
jgi:hypothetical protein